MIENEIYITNIFNTIPVYINIILHRYNYIDNLIISELKKKARIDSFSVNSSDTIFITTEEFKKLFYSKFSKEVEKIKNISIDELNKNATSLYFLHSIFSDFINVRAFNINISYERNYTRIVTNKDVKQIYFSYKIEYGIIDVAKFLEINEIPYLNKFYKEAKIFEIDEEFKIMKASDFIDLINAWEAENQDSEDYYFILDVVYDLILDKIEKDNPMLLIKNDF